MKMDWDSIASADARPANVVLVQEMEGDFLVTFGYAPPPVALLSLDDKESQEYLDENAIKVMQITRILLKGHAAAVLVGTLENHPSVRTLIDAISKSAAQEGEGGSDD